MAQVYDVNQVAEILKVGVSTVRKLINEGKIKALKVPKRGFLINEISLQVFMGQKIEDCIDEKDFKEALELFSKDAFGKVDKDRFFEYYCSWFLPGPSLPSDYYIIKNEPKQNPKVEPTPVLANEPEHILKEDRLNASENSGTTNVVLTRDDIIKILEGLNMIQDVLKSKIR